MTEWARDARMKSLSAWRPESLADATRGAPGSQTVHWPPDLS